MAIDVGSAPHLGPGRTVSADVACTVLAPTLLEYQVTVARVPGLDVRESLRLTVDGVPHQLHEVIGPHGTRIHRASVGGGVAHLEYRAEVLGTALPEPSDDYLSTLYLRPSRYAPVDRFFGFAGTQFPGSMSDAEKAIAVREFVAGRLDYLPGASTPFDGASETLLASAGVCRDYAHLTVALLRALKVPARMTAVFAPGCDPMDFHAVTEALVEGRWYVLDATGLAPRATMMRIATGRDASDIAFLDNHGGSIRLDRLTVGATANRDLPKDDPRALVALT